ncbi:hypothetical protein D1007_13342 [Hordeum vulgare]|nr:hypothetical protein D1007_13342 [Hordeum vulgare]
MRYREELKEHLAAEKQITVARTNEVAMAAILADPQILEEHLDVEATIDTSRVDVAMWLSTLNDSSWHFFQATVGAFNKEYKVFSQCAYAYLNSRPSRLVPRAAQATHHYEEGTHDVEASPSSMPKEPIIIDISDMRSSLSY